MDKYFRLFSCCIPVKGFKRSIVCDLQRNEYDFIPNDLYSILTEDLSLPFETLKDKYSWSKQEIESYFSFLLEKEYGFFTDDPDLFPPISFSWDKPNIINNAIIDFDKKSNHNLRKLSNELTELGCEFLELRFYDIISANNLGDILYEFHKSSIRSIQILLPFTINYSTEIIDQIIIKYSRIKSFIFHSYPFKEFCIDIYNTNIIFSEEILTSELCCGNVSAAYFISNTNLFIESQSFNNCLNKKISIDKEGFIKNCPSFKNNFGSHKFVSLKDIAGDLKFQKLWKITKDRILTCSDCEFRFICQDCRAYLNEPENIFSKPAKCNYNPYEASWS